MVTLNLNEVISIYFNSCNYINDTYNHLHLYTDAVKVLSFTLGTFTFQLPNCQ